MSIKVLAAILGQETLDQLGPDEVRRLADELDAEILGDEMLSSRLTTFVTEAAKRLREQSSAPS